MPVILHITPQWAKAILEIGIKTEDAIILTERQVEKCFGLDGLINPVNLQFSPTCKGLRHIVTEEEKIFHFDKNVIEFLSKQKQPEPRTR